MSLRSMRVVSLLPSATEVLCAVGAKELLVGRSHEDNYPEDIVDRPVVTGKTTSAVTPSAINEEVATMMAVGKSLYSIDVKLLRELKPDLILTQDLCSVCAIDLESVRAVASTMSPEPCILSLNPESLEEVVESVGVVGQAVGFADQALQVQKSLQDRIARVKALCGQSRIRKKVGFIEWSDPIYVAGHWTPQLIAFAGGEHTLNPAGNGVPGIQVQVGGAGKSFPVPNDVFVSSDPDLIVVAPCGFNLSQAKAETDRLLGKEWFRSMRAVEQGNLFVVDGDLMFNRPGPRLVDALEWLAYVIHGDEGEEFPFPGDFPFVRIRTDQNTIPDTSSTAQNPEISIEEAHKFACAAGEAMYIDPVSGLSVFTEVAHLKRGKCCGNGCRHCPYGHYNARTRSNVIAKTTLLEHVANNASKRDFSSVSVLFWSGGKDSFLTYRRLRADFSNYGEIVLLTTIEGSTGAVPHQGLTLYDVMDQSKFLKLDHMIVPLPMNCSNAEYITRVNDALKIIDSKYSLKPRLFFGDLHLDDIINWRIQSFKDYECCFPLYKIQYGDLLKELFSENVTVTISAMTTDSNSDVQIGAVFDSRFIASLPGTWDAMGENGEFHTHVKFPTAST